MNAFKKYFCIKTPRFIIDLSKDISIARKQVNWRVRNMGQLELEIILTKWWENNNETMSLDEIEKFTKDVLEQEIPDLNRYFINYEPAGVELGYINKIQQNLF